MAPCARPGRAAQGRRASLVTVTDRPIPSREEISRRLYDAWLAGPSPEQADELIATIPVPGNVGLRGRFMLLVDPPDAPPSAGFELDWETWQRQVDLTDVADRAVIDHDHERVREATSALIDTHVMGRHPLPIVDAFIADADVERTSDHLEAAMALLEEARTTALTCGYLWGYMRATLAFAYVVMQAGSAQDALALFVEAEGLARYLDDRVLRAGALVGIGEAHDRAGDPDDAIAALNEAIQVFTKIHSSGGIVNTSVQLGDLHRRRRANPEARAAFQQALDLATQEGPWIAAVNALCGLGEIDLVDGDLAAALERYADAHDRSVAYDYRRGVAHALNGLGRVCFAGWELERAVGLHTQARDEFLSLGDHLSASSACTGIADAHEVLGVPSEAMAARLDAVGQIETVRAAQDRHRPQQEFADRFAAVYRNAFETAERAQDVAGFVAVFEGLSGRRLEGLGRSNAENAPALEAQMLAFAQTRDDEVEEPTRARRLARLLGRTALRGHLPGLVSDGIDDASAAMYTPFDPSGAAILLDALDGHAVLAVCVLPGTADEVIALELAPGRDPTISRWTVPAATVGLLDVLASSGLPASSTLDSVQPLGRLLPPEFRSAGGDLLIVCLEQLWAVPWPAIPCGEAAVLGESVAITIAPSLTLSATNAPGPPRQLSAGIWHSPDVLRVNIHSLDDDERIPSFAFADGEAAKGALLGGEVDLLVLVGHGRPAPGIRHLLDLDRDVYVTPVDLMGARVPRRVALICCWGAHVPDGPGGEPLTLAALAAARGAEVLTTTSELADDVPASRFLNQVLHYAVDRPFPQAVQLATLEFLAEPSRRSGYLSQWAPIVTVGRRSSRGDGG